MIELLKNIVHFIRKIALHGFTYLHRNTPDSFRNTSNDGSERIGIGSETDGQTDGILKALAHADDLQGYRYCALAGLIELV